MSKDKHEKMYSKINTVLGDLTPLTVDCGVLCGGACCKGDKNTGMRLFPYEENTMRINTTSYGYDLVVCNGNCDRTNRPLACKIFPFFPTIDNKGRVFVELDYRATRLCPMIEHCDELLFNPKFFKAVKKVGKILSKDKKCKEYLIRCTEEIDMYHSFYFND